MFANHVFFTISQKTMGFITSDEAHHLAERERFELSEPLTVHTISSRAP